MRKKIIISLWILFFLGLSSLVTLFVMISNGKIGYMPPIEELQNPTVKFATQVISSDGKQLGTYSVSTENRLYSSYEDLSPYLVQALIATEDARFTEHSGIDGKALFRVLFKTLILRQDNAGGGSTITQQLAKQLYSPTASSFIDRAMQKPIEWVIATQLERFYTKEEILTMYLNKFDFLHNAVGIQTAANTYFGQKPIDLKVEEAATLIGMCKNPSYFNPLRKPERTRGRRNVVLDQMLKSSYITQTTCDSLKKLPITLDYHRVDHKEGLAPYFREHLRTMLTAKKPNKSKYRGWQKQQYYDDSLAWATNPLYGFCNKYKNRDGKYYNIYTDGLKIYTTIDSRMQKYAEEAVETHLKGTLQPAFFRELKHKRQRPFTTDLTPKQVTQILNRAMKQSDRWRIMRKAGIAEKDINKAFHKQRPMRVWSWDGMRDTVMTPMDSIRYYKSFLRAGFMSMDPHTGAVKAYVGGPNFRVFQYDMVSKGRRQVGSTMKPFLYSLAMENGFTPCDMVRNVQQTVVTEDGQIWEPRNTSDKRLGEMVTLRWGLSKSNNWISAYLMTKLSPYSLVRMLHSFGVQNQFLQPTPALCLGPCDISVSEMVSAYTTFANGGIRCEPMIVNRITDNRGNVILDLTPKMREVISKESTQKMLDMLSAVVDQGTAVRLRYRYKFDGAIIGKTGTTNGHSDGWFMGATPRLVSGCWVGGEDRDIHFDRIYYGQGASMALPIWAEYMKKVYADKRLEIQPDTIFPIMQDYEPCTEAVHDNPILQEKVQDDGLDDFFQ